MSHARSIPRYLVVGGVCALLGNAILIVFDQFGVNYVLSCLVSFVVTVLIAYGFHTHWTFGSDRTFQGLLRYGAAMAVNLPLALALLFLLVSVAGLPMAIAAPALTIIQTSFNYIVASALMRPRARG